MDEADNIFKTLFDLEENKGITKFSGSASKGINSYTTKKGEAFIPFISNAVSYSNEKTAYVLTLSEYNGKTQTADEEVSLRNKLLINLMNGGFEGAVDFEENIGKVTDETYFDRSEGSLDLQLLKIENSEQENETITLKTEYINGYSLVDEEATIAEEIFPAYDLRRDFSNKLEWPCDVFLDASYPYIVKAQIIKNLPSMRDDVHFFMDVYSNYSPSNINGEAENEAENSRFCLDEYIGENVGYVSKVCALAKDADDFNIELTNVSFYAQAAVVSNTYTNNDNIIGATYFLSQLIPTNYFTYGIQYPIAGLTRGLISGIKSISENPDPETKDVLYGSKINYIEKDSRGYKFMCQLTRGEEDTALSYVNNSRTTSKIARDIEMIGRKYLFEFNDTATLSNMSSEMNKYLNEWVQKRTLSYYNLDLSSTDHNRVEVQLGIKFTGTIEIIAVSITIE